MDEGSPNGFPEHVLDFVAGMLVFVTGYIIMFAALFCRARESDRDKESEDF